MDVSRLFMTMIRYTYKISNHWQFKIKFKISMRHYETNIKSWINKLFWHVHPTLFLISKSANPSRPKTQKTKRPNTVTVRTYFKILPAGRDTLCILKGKTPGNIRLHRPGRHAFLRHYIHFFPRRGLFSLLRL